MWGFTSGDLTEVTGVTVADLEPGGVPEVIVGTRHLSGGFTAHLHVLDGATGAETWISPALAMGGPSAGSRSIRVADVDADGRADIVAVLRRSAVGELHPDFVIVDGATRSIRHHLISVPTVLELMDLAGDSAPEAVIAGFDGSIRVLDIQSGAIIHQHEVCDRPVEAMGVNRLPDASPGEVLFTCEDKIGWLAPSIGATRFISNPVGTNAGLGGALLSGGDSPAAAWIATTTTLGVSHLRRVAGAEPYIIPYDEFPPRPYVTHWRRNLIGIVQLGSHVGAQTGFEIADPPRRGTVAPAHGIQDGFSYQAEPFQGVDYIGLRARTATASSTLTYLPIHVTNTRPGVSAPLTAVVMPGSSHALTFGFVDPDLDPLTYDIVQQPAQGQLQTINGDTAILYTVNASASGMDSFQFRAFDQVNHSDPILVNVTIQTPIPPPPPPPPPPPQGGGGGGGASGIGVLAALAGLLLACRRTRRKVAS
jgi:hypothetical protein